MKPKVSEALDELDDAAEALNVASRLLVEAGRARAAKKASELALQCLLLKYTNAEKPS